MDSILSLFNWRGIIREISWHHTATPLTNLAAVAGSYLSAMNVRPLSHMQTSPQHTCLCPELFLTSLTCLPHQPVEVGVPQT